MQGAPTVRPLHRYEQMHDITTIVLPVPHFMDNTSGLTVPIESRRRRRRALANQRAVVAHAYEKRAATSQPLAHSCERRLDVCVALKVRHSVVHRYDSVVDMDWRRREAPHIV